MRADWRWLRDEAAVRHRLPARRRRRRTGRPARSASGSGTCAELRRTDPAPRASSWRAPGPPSPRSDRARFLAALATGLTVDDDAFLEQALDDRRKEVREAALELLRRLPGSSLGRRMAERARAAVRVERGPSGATG